MAGRAIGGTVAGTGLAGVGSRAFHEWLGLFRLLFRVPRDDPVALHDLHGGPAGIRVADCTRRARFARPIVSGSHVMQVFLANFTSAPRWVFTGGFQLIRVKTRSTRLAFYLSTSVLVLSIRAWRALVKQPRSELAHRTLLAGLATCSNSFFTFQTVVASNGPWFFRFGVGKAWLACC